MTAIIDNTLPPSYLSSVPSSRRDKASRTRGIHTISFSVH